MTVEMVVERNDITVLVFLAFGLIFIISVVIVVVWIRFVVGGNRVFRGQADSVVVWTAARIEEAVVAQLVL